MGQFRIRGVTVLAAMVLAYPAAIRAQDSYRPQARPPSRKPAPILSDVGFDQNLNQAIPLDLPFRDESAKSVRLGDYFGRQPVLLSLVYYQCPMLCTLVLNGQARAMRSLTSFDAGREFEAVTVSINPRETPSLAASKKATYLAEYGRADAARGWHFLTGSEQAIKALAKAVGFRYVYDPKTGQFAHATGLVVLTPQGRIARYLYGVDYSPRDLRLSLVEASSNKIGSPVDQVLLFCFHYDPNTGKYTRAVTNALRVAGAFIVFGIVSLVVVLVRHERKSTAPAAR